MYTFPQKNTLEQCLVKTDSIGQSESCKNRRHFVVKHRLLIINHRRYCISLYSISISIGTSRSSSMETTFPCLYNCTVQLYRQTATAVYSRQSGYTYREKSSQLMTTGGGAHSSTRIIILWYKPIEFTRKLQVSVKAFSWKGIISLM